MRLGIFGGTFDPIHVGHLWLGEVTWQALGLDCILYVPAADPPHKQAVRKSSAAHRRAMVERAIADNPHFRLSPVDLERPGPHYTVDTLRLIQQEHELGPDDCYFIIGADSLGDLPAWHQPGDILKLCYLAVARRPGYQPNLGTLTHTFPTLPDRLAWVEMPVIGLGSSRIRADVRQGRSIRYFVPDSVAAYIHEHGLYRD